MWGNWQGWIIAIVLGFLISFGLYQLSTVNHVTIPTAEGANPQQLTPLTFTTSPSTVTQMTQPGDAGAFYLQAIEDVRKNRAEYEEALTSGSIKRLQKLKSIKLLSDAAPMMGMKLLAINPRENVGYFPMNLSQDLADIEKAGLAVEQLGLLYFNNKDLTQAKTQFYAEFALGYKLFSERVCFKEAEKGIAFMRAAVRMLQQIAQIEKNQNRYNELANFDVELGVIFEQMRSMWLIIYSVDNKVVAAHVGDIFLYASDKMQERMWRVESILKIGRFKFNVGGANGKLVDQRAAEMILQQLEKSESDPILQTAILAAQNLTLEQFRAIQ